LLTTVRGLPSIAPAKGSSQLSSEGVVEFVLTRSNVRVDFSTGPDTASPLGSSAQADVDAAIEEEEARLLVLPGSESDESTEVLIEPLLPRPRLLVVGGGHVGRAVAHQADLVGFDVTVLDDREEFTRPALFPEGTTTLCGDIRKEVEAFPFESGTFVVIVTRGHVHDATALAACLGRPAAYVGMIGSRRKVAILRKDFIASGQATAEEFDCVYAPIGLDLGAVTVPEIATSIVAQLIAVRRQGSAPRMPTA
jgi:xanthine dehydrogenase accessory factor